MKPFHLPLGLAVCFLGVSHLVAAPPEVSLAATASGGTETATMSGSSHLRLFRPVKGNPILIVYYPWHVHANASIEVQWLPAGERDPLNIRPLAFVDTYLKGEFAVDAERCRRAAESIATSKVRSQAGIEFEINAKENSLAIPAVWVHCRLPKPEEKVETRTAFCWLENWAMDGRTLYLDLTPDYYGKPGKLRFWMLRGKDTVWMETVAWPGLPGAKGDETAASGEGKPGSTSGKDAAGKATGSAKPKPSTKPAAKPAKKAAEEDDPFADPKAKKKE